MTSTATIQQSRCQQRVNELLRHPADNVIRSLSETHCHTAVLFRHERSEWGVGGTILSQPGNALIDSPYLLRRLGSTSQIRYAFNRGQVLQTTQCRSKRKNHWKDDSGENKAFTIEQLNKTMYVMCSLSGNFLTHFIYCSLSPCHFSPVWFLWHKKNVGLCRSTKICVGAISNQHFIVNKCCLWYWLQ